MRIKLPKIRLRIVGLENLQKNTIIVLSFAAFFLFNLVAQNLPFSLDFSKGKFFSLSPSTKKVLKDVDDVLKIKFYVSSNLPRRLEPVKSTVWSFLKEYEKANPNIEVVLLYPDKDPKVQEEVRSAGLPELQFSQLGREKFEVAKGYFGIVVYYLDKKEVIPQVVNFENLEYELTTAIYRLVNKELPKLAVLGYENPFGNQESPVSTFDRFFSKSFQLNYVKPEDLKEDFALALVFDNGEKRYSTPEAEAINRFLKQGKKAIFFIDGVWVRDDLSYAPADHNLFNLLESRGLKLQRNLVLSASSEVVSFGNQLVAYLFPYPFWIKTDVFNLSSGYFSNVSLLTFPWASEIKLENKNGYKTSWLVKTTKKSWEQKDPFQLIPDNITVPEKGFREFVIGAKAQKGKEEVVVISSRRFVLGRFLRRNDNLSFVSNLALSLSSGGLLSGISLKKPSVYLVPEVSFQVKEAVKYGSILGLPLLYLSFGIIRVLKRR